MQDADGPRLDWNARLGADAALLAEAVLEAGAIALGFFGRNPEIWLKAGESPVTEADYAANRALEAVLIGARPDYGWLSEETADTPARLERERVFVVDPIDGTRAFIGGLAEWVISAAVVEAGRPVAGALFQPVTGDLWLAASGRGAWMGPAAGRIHASDCIGLEGARVAGPRRYLVHPEFLRSGAVLRPYVPSLALRLALVADGRLDVAMASEKAHDWDLAAADLIVHEAGGRLTGPSGAMLSYNGRDLRHPPLVATASGAHDAALTLLSAMSKKSSSAHAGPAPHAAPG